MRVVSVLAENAQVCEYCRRGREPGTGTGRVAGVPAALGAYLLVGAGTGGRAPVNGERQSVGRGGEGGSFGAGPGYAAGTPAAQPAPEGSRKRDVTPIF